MLYDASFALDALIFTQSHFIHENFSKFPDRFTILPDPPDNGLLGTGADGLRSQKKWIAAVDTTFIPMAFINDRNEKTASKSI